MNKHVDQLPAARAADYRVRMIRGWLGAVACAAGVLASTSAHAQEGGFALDQLRPAPAGDIFFGVPSPYASGHVAPAAYLLFNYAGRPIRTANSDTDIVSSQGWLRLDASFALWDRLLLSVGVPLAVINNSEDPGVPGTTFATLGAPEFGDIRIGLRGRLFGAEAGPIQLGLGGYLFVPSGDATQYAGEGAVRGNLHASLGGRAGEDIGFAWTASGGVELKASDSPHVATYGAGLAMFFGGDTFQIGPEIYGATPLSSDPLALSASPLTTAPSSTTLELLGGAKLRVLEGLTFGAAGGPGLLNAPGTPTFRVLGMIGWTPLAKATADEPIVEDQKKDSDDDGITDDMDACPKEAGEPNPDPTKDGCPPADRDGDGILDVDDACPTTAGLANSEVTKNGCPGDGDGDGIHDGIDACPDVLGDASDDPTKNGCPGDSDGDGILDRDDACPGARGEVNADPRKTGCPADPDNDGIRFGDDACPNQRGVPSSDPSRNGCPVSPQPAVASSEEVLPTRILFRSNGNSLGQTSHLFPKQVLTKLRDYIQSHPELVKLEVQGHTDDEGDEAANLRLSEDRAKAVRDWLVTNGISADRLSVRGYGFNKPAADNRIRTGREMNRRVQVVVLRRR